MKAPGTGQQAPGDGGTATRSQGHDQSALKDLLRVADWSRNDKLGNCPLSTVSCPLSTVHCPGPRLILTAPHPSPLSAYRGFFGSRPFSQINAFLEEQGEAPIHWT